MQLCQFSIMYIYNSQFCVYIFIYVGYKYAAVKKETNEKSQALVTHTCNPATLEAEIRKITFRSQLGQIHCKTLSQK
jgi:hypothetical protein